MVISWCVGGYYPGMLKHHLNTTDVVVMNVTFYLLQVVPQIMS